MFDFAKELKNYLQKEFVTGDQLIFLQKENILGDSYFLNFPFGKQTLKLFNSNRQRVNNTGYGSRKN